jgi:hypothetical protein
MILEFTDGMKIDTSGEYRTITKSDGLYVVGHGICVPVSTQEEADSLIASFGGKV